MISVVFGSFLDLFYILLIEEVHVQVDVYYLSRQPVSRHWKPHKLSAYSMHKPHLAKCV